MNAVAIPATIVIGLILYVLRSRSRLAYGLLELGAALTLIVLTSFPPTSPLLVDAPSPWGSLLARTNCALAGIYIMVRSLDNIHEGLSLRCRAKWEHILWLRRQ